MATEHNFLHHLSNKSAKWSDKPNIQCVENVIPYMLFTCGYSSRIICLNTPFCVRQSCEVNTKKGSWEDHIGTPLSCFPIYSIIHLSRMCITNKAWKTEVHIKKAPLSHVTLPFTIFGGHTKELLRLFPIVWAMKIMKSWVTGTSALTLLNTNPSLEHFTKLNSCLTFPCGFVVMAANHTALLWQGRDPTLIWTSLPVLTPPLLKHECPNGLEKIADKVETS